VSVTGQSSIELVHRVAEPRAFGFYDRNGAPLLSVGHDPSFTARAGDGWVPGVAAPVGRRAGVG
jgi:hypothetical protein